MLIRYFDKQYRFKMIILKSLNGSLNHEHNISCDDHVLNFDSAALQEAVQEVAQCSPVHTIYHYSIDFNILVHILFIHVFIFLSRCDDLLIDVFVHTLKRYKYDGQHMKGDIYVLHLLPLIVIQKYFNANWDIYTKTAHDCRQ